jgi:hypothetical protein
MVLPPAPSKPAVITADDSDDLLTAIMKTKNQPVELRKQVLEKQAGDDPKRQRTRGGRGRGKLAPGQKIIFDT